MFKDIIRALRETVGAFDVSDTPEEPISKPAGKPPAPPLKALRGYSPPAKRAKLPGLPNPKMPPRIPLRKESSDIKPKIINKLAQMDNEKKNIIRDIRSKIDMARNANSPKSESKFGPIINEMRVLIERMMKSGLPKVDRQDAMARKVGVSINMPNDLNRARSKFKATQKPDMLARKASLKRQLGM
jgi:hypothetical protein